MFPFRPVFQIQPVADNGSNPDPDPDQDLLWQICNKIKILDIIVILTVTCICFLKPLPGTYKGCSSNMKFLLFSFVGAHCSFPGSRSADLLSLNLDPIPIGRIPIRNTVFGLILNFPTIRPQRFPAAYILLLLLGYLFIDYPVKYRCW